MSRIVGIDLGTTNSLIAYMDGQVPRVITGRHDRAMVPSVVALTDNSLIVGDPAKEHLEEMVSALREAAEGRVIVSGAARLERIEAALGDCVSRAFSTDHTGYTVHRLRESAYVFWKSDRQEDAHACLAAAREFDETALERGSVARALVEQMLAPALESLREEEDPSLLVKSEPALITKP